jgi:hypothetical protein
LTSLRPADVPERDPRAGVVGIGELDLEVRSAWFEVSLD